MATERPKTTFYDHLVDFKRCVTRSALVWAVVFGICYYFAEKLLKIYMHPIVSILPKENQSLYFTNLLAPFSMNMRVAMITAIFIAAPYIFYQIWLFVSPALHRHERKWVIPLALVAWLLLIAGGCFGYFVAFPFGFRALLEFAPANVRPILTVNEYVELFIQLLLAFGIIFETPLVIIFLSRTGIVSARFFLSHWRYALVIITIICAIISPPDVISLIVMLIPCLVLYFSGVFVALLFEKKKN